MINAAGQLIIESQDDGRFSKKLCIVKRISSRGLDVSLPYGEHHSQFYLILSSCVTVNAAITIPF